MLLKTRVVYENVEPSQFRRALRDTSGRVAIQEVSQDEFRVKVVGDPLE
jgi:hypothetical protein